ncbi:MAG: alpha/beta hydrolase [Proteobacteria bacterium]|nr:alpha/beta hydrolase [Pseudomonadota bacterium]
MSRQFDLVSDVTGRSYRVQVALPLVPPPQGGYAVLYVIDADLNFAATATAARLRALIGELAPAVVVGIGYPEAEHDFPTCLIRRTRDLTPTVGNPAMWDSINRQLGGLEVDGFGEAEGFLDMIAREIAPRIAKIAPVATGRDILFGHSLGGLLVIHALFNHPNRFHTFLSLSPSLWWDGEAVLADEPAFSRQVASGATAPAVFIGVGALEQSPEQIPRMPAEEVLQAAMVDRARDLGERLRALPGRAGYRAQVEVFAGQSHMAVVLTAMNSLLDFALAPGD